MLHRNIPKFWNVFVTACTEESREPLQVSGSDSDVSRAIVQGRYLFRVPACLTNPNMSVAHSLVTQHALNSHALSLSIVLSPSGMAKVVYVGACEWPKIAKFGLCAMLAHLRKYIDYKAQREKRECLVEGQADGLGGQGSQTWATMLRTTGWTMHHVKLHQFFQTFPWKYDMVDGRKKNCAGKFLRFKQRSQWSHSRATPWN